MNDGWVFVVVIAIGVAVIGGLFTLDYTTSDRGPVPVCCEVDKTIPGRGTLIESNEQFDKYKIHQINHDYFITLSKDGKVTSVWSSAR